MLDLVLKLIDKGAQLLKHRQATDRAFYDDFVAPTIADFEEVHNNYLDSFIEYKRIIETTSQPLDLEHPILKKIQEDSLYSDNLRAKLHALFDQNYDTTIGAFFRSHDTAIGAFIRSIADYLHWVIYWEEAYSAPFNVYRFSFQEQLIDIFMSHKPKSEKREIALKRVDKVVADLQERYKDVIIEQSKVKKVLLRGA